MVTLPSILDNDFYKFTMQQCVVKLFPRARARYKFINRGHHVFPEGFAAALKASVASMTGLSLSREEKEWLGETCPYLDPVYLDFLQGYRYDPSEVIIEQNGQAGFPELVRAQPTVPRPGSRVTGSSIRWSCFCCSRTPGNSRRS